MQTIEQLKQQFAITDRLDFSMGSSGCVMIDIDTPCAKARIALQGAQVLSYRPADAIHDLLFLSQLSRYGDRRAIRGGVPVCWPWFGDDPSGKGRPAHGFARNRIWDLTAVQQTENDGIKLILSLTPDSQDEILWHCAYALKMTIVIDEQLILSLTTENLDKESFVISQALHTYFAVGNIEKTQVRGLSNHHYLDKVENFSEKLQAGEILFNGETDRVYLNSPEKLFIEDTEWSRRIIVESAGSSTTIVWNPWERVTALKDMTDDAYHYFVCVETANAAHDSISLSPGQSHTISASYRIMPLE
ncbi:MULTISPECIES: D-hexose-6-phosphate mutarotase [unclassified Methylophaga]|uniref:D-hexose-6-phosphate mutarotase n=1 Tax=unclassified Methylophaga TaxID=2629249 RepID=UPI000C90E7D2|nr:MULTISPECIES: D-hexose-6-phosphate mutarotase [unclassified Methylophaga]MBN47707.1 D-hexose-6-phosphate mutarotase [Methylophaga sp.]|tara:strand:+ start:33742 stop:34650 length:909 start_codon:yes stop_codon:yes gene_type:complete